MILETETVRRAPEYSTRTMETPLVRGECAVRNRTEVQIGHAVGIERRPVDRFEVGQSLGTQFRHRRP